jgi:RimJ/RimL family protein N-acetyltransferase
MRINIDTCLVGQRVVLVPYRHDHVSTYHSWMSNKELLELTGSEPLTIDEEYSMQIKWMNDEDKCTFIILDRKKCRNFPDEIERLQKNQQTTAEEFRVPENETSWNDPFIQPLPATVAPAVTEQSSMLNIFNARGFVEKNVNAMVGDVNIFLSSIEDCDGSSCEHPILMHNFRNGSQGELNLMIAELSAQRKGFGAEACQLAMIYGIQFLKVQKFVVKIRENNLPSRLLFELKLKFHLCNYMACFQEYEYEFTCTEAKVAELFRDWMANISDGSTSYRGPLLFLASSV